MADLATRLATAAKGPDGGRALLALVTREQEAGADIETLRRALAEAERSQGLDPDLARFAARSLVSEVGETDSTNTGTALMDGTADDATQIAPALAETVGVGRVIKGRFVLERPLGAGGMGRVFKALDLRRQEARDRHPYVALKALSEQFSRHPAAFITLAREAKKAQGLAHPNIIRVYDFDRDGVVIFMTMEFLDGRSLDAITARPNFSGLPLDEVLAIVRPAGEALAFAHANNLVHCDFKPSNVFLTEENQIKVIDFGIARAVRDRDHPDGDETVFDVGTLRALSPLYASPQMMEEREPDPRDDLFSLGCVTYELLTGQHPFARTPSLVARAKGLQPEKPASLSPAQWSALRRALAFEREDRQASVEAFLAELTAPSTTPRSKRVWPLAAAAGLAALAVAGGLAYHQFAASPSATVAVPAPPTSASVQGTPSDATPPSSTVGTTTPSGAPVTVSVPAASEPPSPTAIQAVLDKVPCAWLRSTSDGPVITISGIAAGEKDLALVRDVLAAVPGVREVISDVRFLGPEKCPALDLFSPLLQGMGNGPTVSFARPDATFYRGEKLMLTVTAPERASFLYVDYYYINKGQLWVVHMTPRPKQKPEWIAANSKLSLGQGGEWQVGPPFGSDLITALSVLEPLGVGSRPEVEPAAPYLAALQKELDRFGGSNLGTVAVVTTKP